MEKFRRKVARKKGWQFERQLNFNTCLTNSAKPGENLVNDGWTDMPRGLPSWARPAMGSWTSRPRAWRSRQPGSTSAPGLTSPSGTPAGQPTVIEYTTHRLRQDVDFAVQPSAAAGQIQIKNMLLGITTESPT
ncbi:hypothetical protein MAP00_000922 [Monascus purpureus]|nr:hypothetical protein MAP00_000922 [Monascus purpureus]